jgi:cellulose synthase/poly-beta-1,6-N-acetylglucosamine synthase-like glycosyltransferase
MTDRPTRQAVPVDFIIPVYHERPEALEATLTACLNQRYPVSRIYVVDDGSPEPVLVPHRVTAPGKICLLRLPQNQGISAARNAAISKSTAPLLACVNSEVLPAPDWLETCANYLSTRVDVGACFTRIVPRHADRLLTRWRMRFQETHFGEKSGPAPFAPGHAVLFRREAVEKVGGYDVRFRRINEDSDICKRMREAGWDTHYIAESQCISIQEDTIASLSRKQLARSDWHSPADYSFGRVFLDQARWLGMRLGRNLLKGRLLFLPVDVIIWANALRLAFSSSIRSRSEPSQQEETKWLPR